MQELEKHLVNQYSVIDILEGWLLRIGVNEPLAHLLKVVIALFVMLLIASLADLLVRKILVKLMTRISKRTKNLFDDMLINRKFFDRLSHFAPALIIYVSIGIIIGNTYPHMTVFIEDICKIYMIILLLMVISSFLDTVNDQYQTLPFSKSRPIKGYLQVLKIVVYFFCIIIIVAIILNKDPSSLIVGLGASTAIMMLVFKDSITGFVSSIQLTANNMLKIGDWIELPSRGIDGNVIDINLTTVKVQNFDNTISTVPPIALVSESYINWRGMEESDGRRIKRSISIDLKTVKFCTPEMLERYKKIGLIANYVQKIQEQKPIAGTVCDVADNATNMNIFRHYVIEYLNVHPLINHKATLIVRLRQPDQYGVPMEIYCFSAIKAWADYEEIQSNIFDHIVAAVESFDLKLYQRMSGSDFRDTMLNSVKM